MVAVVFQPGVIDPLDLAMLAQVAGHRAGVFRDAVHAQRQRLDALQDQKGIERRDRRPGIPQRDHARAADVSGRSKRLGINHAVVRHVRLVEAAETLLVLGPRKLARIDNHAADGIAVPAQVLGERMDHDVGAMLERAQQVWRGYRVIDDQRHAVLVRHGSDLLDVGDIAQRVADRLDEHGLGALVDEGGERRRIGRIGKARGDAELRQRVRKQVVRAAVQGGGRDDVVAGLGNGLDRIRDRRLSRRQRQRPHAALERSQALLEHVLGGIHDARINIARHL